MLDIYKNIEEGVYNNNAEVVSHKKPSKVCPECEENLTTVGRDAPKFCHNCGAPFAEHYNKLLAIQVKKQRVFQDEQHKKKEQFKRDALEYCGLTDHAKADRAFEIAWDEAHSSGLREIVDYLETLSEVML